MSFEEATSLRRGDYLVGAFDTDAVDAASGGTDDAVGILLSCFPKRDRHGADYFECIKSELQGATSLVCLYQERSDGDYELRGFFNAALIEREYLEQAVAELNNGYCDPGWKLVDVEVDYSDPDVSFTPDILESK